MDKLSKALESIRTLREQKEQSKSTSSTQAPGSIIAAGKMNTLSTTQQPSQPMGQVSKENQNHNEHEKRPQGVCLAQDPSGQKNLTILLATCFDALKVYGKEPEQLESLNSVFQMCLSEFTFAEVREAFKVYLMSNAEMPAPADIVKIIRPPRVWCATSFIDIKRRSREGEYITQREQQYCVDFVARATSAPEEQRIGLEKAIKSVELEDRRYDVSFNSD